MRPGTTCKGDYFPGGITNGAHWYTLSGGMQDYNYRYTNCFEITLELSCCKYPLSSKLKSFWTENKDSLIAYMQQVHSGVKGIVKLNDTPIANATVRVIGNSKVVKTTKDGEYWRLLMPGKHVISVNNYLKDVTVYKGRVTRLDFQMADAVYRPTNSSVSIYSRGWHLLFLILTLACRGLFT